MSSQRLFYIKYFCPQTLQVLITAQFLNKKLQLNEYNKKYDVISLLTQNGILNKSTAILRYLAHGTNLIPSPSNKSQSNQLNIWYEYFNIELYPLLIQVYGQVFGQKQPNQKKYNYCHEEIHKNLKILDDSLKIKSFFIGNNLTIFDITLVCYLENVFKLIITQTELKKYTNLKRWFNHVRDIPIFNKFYGKKILCGNTSFKIQFNKQQIVQVKQIKQAKQVKQVKVKQVKQVKKLQPKKQQVKKDKKSQQVTPTPASEGSFKLDDWKRQFQNSPNKVQVVKNLLNNFQKQDWSIWKIHYQKDVTEGKILFLTQNLANGTLQRLQSIRKTGFGSWGVYGQQGKFQIRGVMMWKGLQKHQSWKQHPSVEYHLFTKLDPSNVQDRNLIFDYWMEKQCAEGLMHRSTKIIV